MRYARKFGLAVLAALMLACAELPKQYAPKKITDISPDAWLISATKSGHTMDMVSLLPGEHWKPLLEQLLNNNPALQRNSFSVAELYALAGKSRAAQLPQLGATVDKNRSGAENVAANSRYTARLDVSWELDLWGRLDDQGNAADYDVLGAELDLEYAKRSLLADAVHQYLLLANNHRKLSLEQRRLAVGVVNEQVIQKRYRRGISSLLDLSATKAEQFRQYSTVESLQLTITRNQHQLRRLFGSSELPDTQAANHINTWLEVDYPKVELPAEVLIRRPDVLAALQKINAADERSQVAFKALLPSFKISASAFGSASGASALFKNDPSWNILSQLVQPLFQGGRLKADIKVAEAKAAQAYWLYREVLLAAVLEVSTALSTETSLAKRQQSLESSLQYAQQSQLDYEQRYQRGLATILDVIAAQKTSFDVESQLLDLERERASNRVTLALALGLPIQRGED